jgi:hypothetical protein
MTRISAYLRFALLFATVYLPDTWSESVSGGGLEPGPVADICGNTATLDCSATGATCTDGARWAAAPDQPQTYEKSDTVVECSDAATFPNNAGCIGSGYIPTTNPNCEAENPG